MKDSGVGGDQWPAVAGGGDPDGGGEDEGDARGREKWPEGGG